MKRILMRTEFAVWYANRRKDRVPVFVRVVAGKNS
jgi:hypothetical protein